MKPFHHLLIACITGLLLWLAWPVSPMTLLIFIAWIPLLWVESKVTSRKKFFLITYLVMFIWNFTTTWWIWNASPPGAVAAFFANSLLMCFPWLGFKIAKKWLGERWGYVSLVAFWMCFEFIHLTDWGLSWPWLTLGNVFAIHPEWVQWYAFTGTSGGSLWIWIVNIFLFLHIKNNAARDTPKSYRHLLIAIPALALPIVFSAVFGATYKNSIVEKNVVVVQPNIDPYEKISTGSFEGQLQQLIKLSEEQIDENTQLVVWPETALYMEHGIEETAMKKNYFLHPLWGFLQRHPQLVLFTGVESYREYNAKETPTAREMGGGKYYDAFNGSVLLDSTGAMAFYHKSMLVPGVETLPWFLQFIDSWFEKFGGTTAGYAKQRERTVLDTRSGYRIAPSICYESIYGEFMSRYIKGGANLVCIITNDGWWKNTPGHKQHMQYARLRAIETGTWIARSANTGISCFIDPYGNIRSSLGWGVAGALKMIVPDTTQQSSDQSTFFVQHGDILSRIMTALSIAFICWTIVRKIRNRVSSNRK